MNTYKNSIGGSDCKESTSNARDLGLTSGLGRSPGEGNGYSFQHFGLENSMDRGTLHATVHEVTKSWTRLSDFHFYTDICIYIYKDMCVYVHPKIQHIYTQFVLSSQLFDVF